ncbi:MAG: hypothetical protein A2431_02605 [Candidatus Zambryskibacteria bacterium RIFOXYC1_FULL_39_10]|uniref:Uncharacterized protein n=1 Tax=Candidatus Zambryskibacteria bacterium RIFOXYC1_FULL_39_10 TaxID=1802779 RepID=A0A1G2V1H7_9BACT|nr:MAG: hypothetical protein A2431_02605 [Candidatus Zambryskibacteria bacterium RIFOXYC1_FULL_39_10]OHB16541.1 MAG: hypothetical protein A2605_03420 [Candidatus Zambryskibacteria bacterium RIFOXYD1_FULL_39_35]
MLPPSRWDDGNRLILMAQGLADLHTEAENQESKTNGKFRVNHYDDSANTRADSCDFFALSCNLVCQWSDLVHSFPPLELVQFDSITIIMILKISAANVNRK